MRRVCVLAACLSLGCGDPDRDPASNSDSSNGVRDVCEGGLAEVDGECIVLENAMDVLIFRTNSEPYATTCTNRVVSDDPGINEAVIAESGACRVVDVDRYGPSNLEPASREPGVTLQSNDASVPIDEAEIFEACLERRTVPEGFFELGTQLVARFDGSPTIPAFDESIEIPADPRFARGPLLDGGPVVFSWTDVGADRVLVVVAELPVQIVCTPDPTAGQFEVPAELVAMLPESDPPGLAPLTSIRLRNRRVFAYPEHNAVVTLTADTYQAAFQ